MRQADSRESPEFPIRANHATGVFLGPATTQNLVVKFDGEICGGVLVENVSDDFPQQKKLENLLPNFAGSSPPISPKTSPTSLWKSLVLTNQSARVPTLSAESLRGVCVCVGLEVSEAAQSRLHGPELSRARVPALLSLRSNFWLSLPSQRQPRLQIRSRRNTVRKCTGPKWSKMVILT